MKNLSSTPRGLLGLANDATPGADGWVKLAGYRDYPKTREVLDPTSGATVQENYLQRVTPENATRMATQHNSFFGKLRRLRRGAPIFRGHADRFVIAAEEGVTLPDQTQASATDYTARLAMFAELQARTDGLYGLPVFSDEARTAIENEGLKYFSPFWWTNITGETLRDGLTWLIAEPVEFISAALTNSPNIPDSPALANESVTPPTRGTNENLTLTMKKKLLELLAKYGIALANESDALIEAGLSELDSKLTQRAALDNEKRQHDETRTALDNTVGELNELTIDLAIAEGRIAASERKARLEILKQSGAPARKALLNESVKFKLTATTTDARRESSAALENEAATALAAEMRRHIAAGKTRSQALDLVIKQMPEVYRAYRAAGCSTHL